MILVGGLVTGASALAFAKGDTKLLRLGYWSLLAISFPGYVIMRIGAEWIYSKEGWDDVPDEPIPTWLDIGYLVADVGALILLISLVVGGIGMYRLRQGKGAGLLKVTLVLAVRDARGLRRRRLGDGRQAATPRSARLRPAGRPPRRGGAARRGAGP